MAKDDLPPEPKAEPNISAIIGVLEGKPLAEALKKQANGLSEVGKIFQKIEKDLAGNRQAVKHIQSWMKMDADKRNDMIRTLEPLMVHYKLTLDDIEKDDLLGARGNEKNDDPGDDDDDHEDDEGNEEESETHDDPPPPGSNEAKSPLDKARAHLTGGSKKPTLGLATKDGTTVQ